MKKIILTALIAFGYTTVNAQEESKSPFTFTGYIDTYYSYDFGKPDNHTRPGFLYNYNKHNEVNLNLGLAKVNYAKDNVRGNFALMAGTYAEYNLAAEQGLLKNVYEANVGVKISQEHNLWIDAGIMPSHIGFESAIGKDCMTLTRSILAENSPYYEAGVKLGYTSKSEKWYLAVMYLNGWQRIQKVEGNQTPAFGSQVTYKPNSGVTLNWSTYVGNEYPDVDRKWRYFNDFFGQFRVSEKVNLIAGFDIGAQQATNGSSNYDIWYTPIVMAQYKPTNKIQLAARGEYYQDKKGVIIATGTPNGFKTYGFSANFDYLATENVIFRLEARTLNSKDNIFLKNNNPTDSNVFITTSLAISL
ncbi:MULTISPECIES: porin [unclassified Flavobacterium]|uniref:porin n=1 Tax=unclassified Flavobacterium TaxID=196869 RepID=UPI000F0C43A5|nr:MULTISPECIES: porin [unclassified Flavobacterium]AYN04646.1 porin [Flavobacterium sp. 140616W15]MCD0474649.1 porin [Flavobacterium sp. EDS]